MIDVVWYGQSHVYDDGTDEKSGGNMEWFDDSPATCAECDWSGEAGDLKWPTKIPAKLREILVVMAEFVNQSRDKIYSAVALKEMDMSEEAFDKLTDLLDEILEENK
jgi:hypothetical protein